MEGPKLELSGGNLPSSYKLISEADMEEEAVSRPKSLVKSKPASPELDGADEKMLPKEEKVEAKISPNEKQNGDAKLDIGELKSAFVGLTKEELMKYANDPFWVRLRWFLFITFWILWGMMLLGAIMIICAAPKCDPPPPKTWWQKGPLAEIERDLEAEEIRELKDEGVTGVILSWPEDAYINFDETHDFIKSLNKYKDQDLNVIIELEPGSSEVWFNKSENKDAEFNDYYIWMKDKGVNTDGSRIPPNNWLTVDNNSSWIYSDKKEEFYYAPSGKPQLNFRNQKVIEIFSSVLKKFLEYGIGGIRLRGVPFLLVDPLFRNEEMDSKATSHVLTEYEFYKHAKTENLDELGELLKQWRIIVKNKTENGPFMAAEDLRKIEAYKVNNSLVVDLPVQSHLCAKPNLNVTDIVNVVTSIFNFSEITWPLWKCHSTEALDIVTYLLPGTPLIKQGTPIKKELLKIRNSPSIMRGIFDFRSVNNKTVFAFIRVAAGNPGILVAFNPTDNRVVVDFPEAIEAVTKEVTVQLFSSNYNESGIAVNVKQDAHKIPISPNSAIVLSYVPSSK
ncbi:neutral and basic amino acid transport protein rBAT [Asbolus verrucosus]|uniref:alpha-glucosidase n=1 Tax=Asbolus verrucosus TaxID=1661398 RepID=A0A482W2K2_ASBVE|nr:neutral and basic amino acid transport protein rBAT [Asbolus verrucosus]